jgi:mono/diheme cytochrome c family protein
MTRFLKTNRLLADVIRAQAAIKLIATVWSGFLLTVSSGAASAQDFAALIAEGRAIYRGSTPLDQPPTLHGVPLQGSSASCASCHGARGAARTEGGVAVPAIQWQRLAQATPARAAYADGAEVLTAVTDGRTREGRSLSAPMPRFALNAQEQRALVAYLQVLGTEADPVAGVSERRIVLGTVLPQSGPQAAAGDSVRAALQRRIAAINAAGGIFGRQLELVVADAGPNAASATPAAIDLVRSGRVFALVASWGVLPTDALRQALARHDTAMVATLGLSLKPPRDPLLSWLLPSLQQQATELAAELTRMCPSNSDSATPTRVLYLAGGELGELGKSTPPDAPDQAAVPARLQWQAVTDAATLRTALRQQPASRTLVLLPAALAEVARIERAGQGHAGGCIGTLAAVSGESSTVASVRELVALPMPPVPLNDSADARTALWPLLADSSLTVMAEALSRAGRQLDTERLVSALDTLHRFEARPGLPVSFSARQRHGFDVSYLWKEGRHEIRSSAR